jgi:hypothetical protein
MFHSGDAIVPRKWMRHFAAGPTSRFHAAICCGLVPAATPENGRRFSMFRANPCFRSKECQIATLISYAERRELRRLNAVQLRE